MREHRLSDDRRNLVDLINKRGGFRGRKLSYEALFNEEELVGILDFENPNAIYQPEYSYEYNIIDERGKDHRTHNILNFDHINLQRDLKLATQLGGYGMRNRMQKVLRQKTYSRRRKRIYNILQELPERYRSIKEHIIQNDLNQLTSLYAGKKSSTIRQICVLIAKDRANSLGMHPQQDELLEIFTAKNTGLLSLKYELKQANMLGKTDRKLDNMKIAALNLLLELKEKGIIGKKQSLNAQSKIFELDQFPRLFKGSKHMDIVIAFAALMVDQPQMALHALASRIEVINGEVLGKYYQAMKRAMRRSPDYMEYINTPSLIENPVLGVMVDNAPLTVIEDPLSMEAPSVKIMEDKKILEVMETNDEVDEIPDKNTGEVIPRDFDKNEFTACWQISDEIMTGVWYSIDTFLDNSSNYYSSKTLWLELEEHDEMRGSDENLLIENKPFQEKVVLMAMRSSYRVMHNKDPPILLIYDKSVVNHD